MNFNKVSNSPFLNPDLSSWCSRNSSLFSSYLEQFSQIGSETCFDLVDSAGYNQICCFAPTSEIWKIYIAPLLLCLNEGFLYENGNQVYFNNEFFCE